MDNFTYAHNDTSRGERTTATAQFNRANLSDEIRALRDGAFEREIPTASDETLCFLRTYLSAVQPKNILELGTAVGVSGAVMLQACPSAKLTTIERERAFYDEAKKNFSKLGLSNRATAVFGDAGEIIRTLTQKYDFIFLDCAKVQYIKYLPRLKELLLKGGTLCADDVLLFGWVTGESEPPKKRAALVRHVREYIDAVTGDSDFATSVIGLGDGIALSVKIK